MKAFSILILLLFILSCEETLSPNSTTSKSNNSNNQETNSLVFDGIDDFIKVSDNGYFSSLSQLTLQAWVKLYKVGRYNTIISNWPGVMAHIYYIMIKHLKNMDRLYLLLVLTIEEQPLN